MNSSFLLVSVSPRAHPISLDNPSRSCSFESLIGFLVSLNVAAFFFFLNVTMETYQYSFTKLSFSLRIQKDVFPCYIKELRPY